MPGSILRSATMKSAAKKEVSFSENAQVVHAVPYSNIFNCQPSLLVATRHGQFKKVSTQTDPYTGKSVKVGARREVVYSSALKEQLKAPQS